MGSKIIEAPVSLRMKQSALGAMEALVDLSEATSKAEAKASAVMLAKCLDALRKLYAQRLKELPLK